MEYTYAALLLHKLGKDVSEANLKKVIAAADVAVDEAKVKTLVASLQGVDIDAQLAQASMMSAAPASDAGAKQDKQEKPKEEKKEAAAEGLSALFG